MKEVKVICPKCGKEMTFKNYWTWVWKTQFHLLGWDKESKCIRDYRRIKCSHCGEISWAKRVIKCTK